jgi:hypothetical protein
LRTELLSDRWRDDLRALLKRAGLPDCVVTAPDLGDDAENQARLRLNPRCQRGRFEGMSCLNIRQPFVAFTPDLRPP